jgi:serine/threonine-protein kinase RsbW
MPVYRLTYPSVVASEESMLEAVKKMLTDNDVASSQCHSFLLTVSEAFTNALIHGNKYSPDKKIQIIIEINSQRLSADIIDQGEGGVAGVELMEMPDCHAEGGRGIAIIRHYASSLDLIPLEGGGLKVSISLERKNENCNSNAWRS